jgi:hypothetical protein
MGNGEVKNSWSRALIDLVKIIPYVGKLSDWIDKYFGSKGLIGAFIGGLIVAGTVYINWYPAFLVSKKYRVIEPEQETISRKKPDQVKITFKMIPYQGQEDWLIPHIHLLEEEGDTEKQFRKITDYKIVLIESQSLSATEEFHWKLTASREFLISGWGFRKTSIGSYKFIQPLNAKKTSTEYDIIRFTVTQCEKGDNLIGILRISGTDRKVPKNLLGIVESLVE